MPATTHPQASFEPIPPHLDLYSLVDSTPNFEWVLRISAAQIRSIGPHEFEKLVRIHVIQGGKPLVIDKWNDKLKPSLFSAQWLEKTNDKKQENVRDLVHQTDIPMTMGHYLRSMKQLTNQWNASNYRDDRRQRLYLKDIDCPPEWRERLEKIIPRNLWYFNDDVDKKFGDQDANEFDYEYTASKLAPAGDLMSSLPEEMRAENLMCYIGHEGTYTPAHREMCASLGQNIMVEASGDENGEKEGSSIWFMTESKDREVVREYFLSMLGHDIEIEKHFAQINAWKKAHFPVYVVEQRVGDFVLVPPLAPHQVWNRGTRTVKVAWNRTTVESLELALVEALPKARLVCRDEQYKNKAIIYFTLQKYYKQMVAMDATAEMSWLGIGPDLIRNSVRMRQMAQDFRSLFYLFTSILADEMFATKEAKVENLGFDSNITCSYCRSNIFNRFLTCKYCVRDLINDDQDTYDVCMECYAMGRSCMCISGLSWCEQWDWTELMKEYEDFRAMIIKIDGFVDLQHSPMPLEIARKRTGKKSVAQICQEQLHRRPWKDITKDEEPMELGQTSEPEVDENGRPKRKPRKRKKGDVYRCHVCSHPDYRYRLGFCSNIDCTEAYCYGVLYRAFDTMPQTVMQDESWQCPKCRKICNCGKCRASGLTNPYTPKMTLLGHDTRSVADDRSVESLVDFRLHNLQWLKATGDETRNQHSRRLEKLKEVANAEKAKEDGVAGTVELPDGGIAHAPEADVQEPVANGYGGHHQTGDGLGPDEAADDHHGSGPVEEGQHTYGGHPGSAAVADMSFDHHAASALFADMSSSYPDPPAAGLVPERMIGMGYYEQDESEDRIIFDPYQAPSAEAVAAEEPISESVMKQIKAAKRRARQLDHGDTDFVGPKAPPRKKRKTQQPESGPVENMDPALLGSGEADTTMPDAPADVDTVDARAQPDDSGVEAVVADVVQEADGSSPYHPTLRHARPKVSYVEVDDGLEEYGEVLATKDRETTQEGKAEVADASQAGTTDPLDLAADAIRALAGVGPTEAARPAKPTKKEAHIPSRPRGRPRKSDPGPAKKAATPQTQGLKRRGRPPRAPLPAAVVNEPVDDEPAEDAIEVDGDDADVTNEVGEQLADEPPADNEAKLPEADATSPVHKDVTQAPTGRKRGRPPKLRVSETQPSDGAGPPASSVSSTVRVEIQSVHSATPTFTSMAERMAMKGKKFKIGKRKAPASAESVVRPVSATSLAESDGGEKTAEPEDTSPPPDPPTEPPTEPPEESTPTARRKANEDDDNDDFEPVQEERPSSSAPSAEASPSSSAEAETPFRARRKSSGPTVVRLMSDDDDDEEDVAEDGTSEASGAGEDSPSDDSSSDDEDIPNTRPSANLAKRGRPLGFRGRGQGRGRARGPGRGRWH